MLNFSQILPALFPVSSTQSSPQDSEILYEKRYSGEATVVSVELATQRPYWVGRVAFRGTTWNARTVGLASIKVGDLVEVLGSSNITLIVQPFKTLEKF